MVRSKQPTTKGEIKCSKQGTKGKNLIIGAISSFEKIVSDLQEGISSCRSQVQYHTDQIDEHTEDISALEQHIDKAEIIKNNITKMISQES